MSDKLKCLILLLALLLQVRGALAHENIVVHAGLSEKARELLAADGSNEATNLYFDRDGQCNDIREGSVKEDNFLSVFDSCGVTPLSWLEHGYDPINGEGWGWGTGTATNKAGTEYQEAIDAYNSCDKERAYFQLGRVVHLLEDMTSPAHVHSDVHATRDDFESWSSTPNNSPRYDTYANGTQITAPASLSGHFQSLALKTYYASSFGAVLNESTTAPINPTSELARMFPGKVHYIPFGLWGVSYWVIDDVGEYNAELANDDWWQCADDPGYYYLENANGDGDIGLVPPEMRIDLENRTSPMGGNSQTILTRWAQVLFPETVNYSAGLMKYFHDGMHGANDRISPANPGGLKGRAGNQKASLEWVSPLQDGCGDTLADLDGYRVYYDTTPAYSNPSTRWSSDEALELTGLTNGTTYFVCVKAVDTIGNESECSATVTVRPENAIWVHASGGPSDSETTISDALAAAGRGDTIIVGPGVYQEPQLFVRGEGTSEWDPQDITLRSERGPGETIIVGDGNQEFVLSMADRTRIIGFTIRNGGFYGIFCWFGEDILVANNIFMSNDFGIYVGGTPSEAGRPVRIYNNVFIGNVRSARGVYGAQYYSENDLSIDIKNNIFQGVSGQGTIGVELSYCQNVVIEHNDFSGLSRAIVATGGGDRNFRPSQRSNSTFSPGFESFIASFPENGDYHLADGSHSRDAGATSLSYDGQAWEDCDGTRTDLGAYGGPFAYVDNDPQGSPWHGIPDCLEPRGRSATVAVMVDSADAPVTLKAQNQTADLAYQVVEEPTLGTLAGTAPALLYSSGSVAGQDGLSFTVANTMGASDAARVDIRVKSSNAAPTALDQTIHMAQNAVGVVILEGSDVDGDALTFAVDSAPGSLAVSCPNPPTCYLLPTEEFLGATTFTFHANDGFSDSAPATVTVSVEPAFQFVSPGNGDVWMSAGTFAVTWDDDEAGTRLMSLYAGQELLAAGIPESDPLNSYGLDVSSFPEGTYEISALFSDGILFEEIFAIGALKVDRTPPTAWAEPAGGLYVSPQAVRLYANEEATIYYTVDGSEPTTSSARSAVWASIDVLNDQTVRFLAVDLGGNQSMAQEVYIVDSAPTAVSLSAASIPENKVSGTGVGVLSTADPDAGDTFTYTIVPEPGTDHGSFQIAGDQLQTAISLDYEGQQILSVKVKSTDQDGLWTMSLFAINVTDLNEAPLFAAGGDQQAFEDAGPQSVPGWATAISGGPGGESGQAVDFIVSNDNAPLFAVQPAISANGTLSYVPAAEASGSATVTVRLHDSGGTAGGGADTSDPQTFTITVTSVNDSPGDIQLTSASVTEIAAVGSLVGTLSTTDNDAGDVFTYTLVPGAGDNASFEIIGNELWVNVLLNFTIIDPYSVYVRSTDLAGASIEEVFTISAPAAYVLWTRSDTGQAVLWKINPSAGTGSPKVIPIGELANLYSTSGIGGPWEATSYEYVSATEAYVLWTRSDTGQAVLWKINPSAAAGSPKVIPISELASIHSASGIGGPWRATSYAHASATEGYVLWTRSDTGQAVLWKINPSAASGSPRIIPRTDLASLQSTAGVGSQWQATSYEHVSATEGYVLWTRSDTGRGVLWKIDPSAGSGSPKIIPVSDLASLQSTTGIGGPWQTTSYEYVSATEAYVLWTRSDTGQAVQWRINPSAASGTPKVIPIGNLASLYSASGVGSPWQATSYFRIGQVREGTEQAFNPSAPEGASWLGTEIETGVQTEVETGVEIGIEWMMGIWNEQEFWIAQ